MTGKQFFKRVTGEEADVVGLLLDLLRQAEAKYCVIGGLAVNAYAEPVVSLDLDLVVVADKLDVLAAKARACGLKARDFEHSVNLSLPGSHLRIQLQTDLRYQRFLTQAVSRKVLDYRMKVARLEDVLQGKLWAYADETRRASKRQKDLADILRLAEKHPKLKGSLPPKIASLLG